MKERIIDILGYELTLCVMPMLTRSKLFDKGQVTICKPNQLSQHLLHVLQNLGPNRHIDVFFRHHGDLEICEADFSDQRGWLIERRNGHFFTLRGNVTLAFRSRETTKEPGRSVKGRSTNWAVFVDPA